MLIHKFTRPYQHTSIPAYYRFTNIVCKYGGSAHDAYILANSCIPDIMEQLPNGGWLLGDSGYPLRPWLMTPILTPLTKQQEKQNASHIKTRNCVERSFGVLKSRFRQVLTTVKTRNTYKS